MIRSTIIAALTALLILVLYLPSRYPPETFVERIREEHTATGAFWSRNHADRILTRTLDAHETTARFTPVPQTPGNQGQVTLAASQEMARLNVRLFGNAYFRSVDALVLLATYRLFTLIEWLPGLLPFVAAALIDGACMRSIRARQLGHHDPEVFALCVVASLLTAASAWVAFVLPLAFASWALPVLALLSAGLLASALRYFPQKP